MIKINIGGDFAVSPEYMDTLNESKLVDTPISSLLEQADYNIINIEAPIIDSISPAEKFGPSLYMLGESIDLLKKLQINVVSLANNHILDHGEKGLCSTFEYLDRNDIQHFGAGYTLEEAKKPIYLSKGGLTVGVLNFAENEFSNTHGDYPGAAPLDIIDNTLQIQGLKSAVDKIIVIVHGGAELHNYPSPRFYRLLRYFAKQGADAVIAHHTHRYNGTEIVDGVPIVYGTGNFLFPVNTDDKRWNLGVICSLIIEKDKPIKLENVPISFGRKNPTMLQKLHGDKYDEFSKMERDINLVINSKSRLLHEYQCFVDRYEKQYMHFLQPYTSKYLHKFFSLGIIPNFLSIKIKKLLYLNLIRCEAHRDVLINILSQ
jgi:poly-gamma-glutamate synthesis protein (capsule biosynthesis protein)